MRIALVALLALAALPLVASAPGAAACDLSECGLPISCDLITTPCEVCVPDLDGHVWCTFLYVWDPCSGMQCF